MQKTTVVVAAVLVALAGLFVQPAAAAPRDWSEVVDFAKTGLDRFNPADAALLKMTAPERIHDPAERVRFQQQMDSLQAAQTKVAQRTRARGGSRAEVDRAVWLVASPAAVATIDPGCQLTSSNPGGYDLCAYNSVGDTMSTWASGRKQVMWSGLQEADAPDQWRVWTKSQAYGQTSSNVDHWVDLKDVQAWERSEPNQSPTTLLGTGNPLITSPACAPCYVVGTTWRPQHSAKSFGMSFVRDFVEIKGTADNSATDNGFCSGWWYRSAGVSYYPGPNHNLYYCPGP